MKKAEVNKLDKMLSKLSRESEDSCWACGNTGTQLHPHHIITRKHRLLRWSMCNIYICCFACHQEFHGNPMWAVEKLTEDFGESYLDMLRDLRGIVGVKRTYEQAVEEMGWDIEEYYKKYYLKEVLG